MVGLPSASAMGASTIVLNGGIRWRWPDHCGYHGTLEVALRGHDLKHGDQSIGADLLRDASAFGPGRGD